LYLTNINRFLELQVTATLYPIAMLCLQTMWMLTATSWRMSFCPHKRTMAKQQAAARPAAAATAAAAAATQTQHISQQAVNTAQLAAMETAVLLAGRWGQTC
jgi:hypothetical protein